MTRPTPLLDFFKRGEVARDVKMLAAQGGLETPAHEQLAILVVLLEDTDPEVRSSADATLNGIPVASLQAFLGRSDVPVSLREFFADRGVFPAETPEIQPIEPDEPLIKTSDDAVAEPEEEAEQTRDSVLQKIAKMGFTERLKAASKGTREMRSILIRDPNKMIAA